MFEGPNFPKSLDEDKFDLWLEKGRESKIKYQFMMVIWDDHMEEYSPQYFETRDDLASHAKELNFLGQERLVATYDLYSESRLNFDFLN